jgi:hypothetical protein
MDSSCIQNDMPIKHVPYWNCLDSNGYWVYGEPWHANTCDVCCNQSSAPINGRFTHYPRTGNGMALNEAIIPGFGNNYREYLQGHLYKPLSAGKTYCVCFYVCQTQQAYYSVSNIGAYLDNGTIDTAIQTYAVAQTQYTPQIMETALLTDTLSWTKIEGSFIANGTERLITIGIFTDDAHTNKAIFNSQSLIGQEGCYLVDDISVIESDIKAYAGPALSKGSKDSVLLGRNEIIPGIKWYRDGVLIDTLHAGLWCKDSVPGVHMYKICQTLCGVTTWDSAKVTVWPVNVGNVENVRNVKMWPNPFTDELLIDNLDHADISLYDVVGRNVYSEQQSSGKVSINTKRLSKGMYIIEITDVTGNRIVQKIIKQ